MSPQRSRKTHQEGDRAPPSGLQAAEPAEAVQLHVGLPMAQGTMAEPASILKQLLKPLNPLILQSTQGTFAKYN